MKRSRSGKSGVRIPGTKKKGTQPKKQTRTTGPQPLVITHRDIFPKGSFAKAGGMLGSIFGPKGAAIGAGAGSMLSRITGVGDYKVKSNSIMTDTASFSGEVPAFGKTDNSTRVRHREFVMDVTMNATPAAFRNTSYVIQPSNATLFPWLSSLAQNYQQYRLHGCVFVFKSTTSDYSAAGALGKVAMATNYNVRDSDFINMQELENAEFSVSGKPSLSRVHPIECAPNNGVPLVKWVRDAQYDASGGDDRLYDVGKFQFATSGLPSGTANAVIGELWISYDIEFFKPIINRQPTAQNLYEPVAVPVFDNYAGGATAGTNSSNLYMMESCYIEKPSGGWASRSDAISKLRSPGSYSRAYMNLPDEPYGGARVTRSAFRADPDPSIDPAGNYPAYWENASTLVLQRKGVYAIRQFAHMLQRIPGTDAVARATGSVAWNTYASANVVPNNATPAQLALFARVETDGPSDSYSILYSRVPSAAYTFGQPGDLGEYGIRDAHKLYSTDVNWEVVIWVKQDILGDGVKVKFFDEVNASNDRSNNIGMQWDGVNQFNMDNLDYFGFQVSFLSASMATYYQPVVQGLTSDDKQSLKDSLGTVEALLPKLRELGLL